jgi:hypothetical protein
MDLQRQYTPQPPRLAFACAIAIADAFSLIAGSGAVRVRL